MTTTMLERKIQLTRTTIMIPLSTLLDTSIGTGYGVRSRSLRLGEHGFGMLIWCGDRIVLVVENECDWRTVQIPSDNVERYRYRYVRKDK